MDLSSDRHYVRLRYLARFLDAAGSKASRIELGRRIREVGGASQHLVIKGKKLTRTFWVPVTFAPTPTPEARPIGREPI